MDGHNAEGAVMEGMLGLIGSILGVAAQAKAQEDQKQLEYQNLFETKRENRFREKLATSSKTDANGNTVYYDPALKQWKIRTSPETGKILEGQQVQELAGLTEDAPRNRAAAVRRDARSQTGDEEFNRLLTDYKYRPKKSEADYVGDATTTAMYSRRRGSSEAAAAVNQALIRNGNSSNIPAVFQAARDAEAQDFESVLSGAKRQGQQDYLNFEGGKDQKSRAELDFFHGLANDTENTPVRFGGQNADLSNERDSGLQQFLQVLSQSQSSRGNATGDLAQALGRTPDFSSLASSLGKIGGSMGGGMGKASLASDPAASGGGIDPAFWSVLGDMGYLSPSKTKNGF